MGVVDWLILRGLNLNEMCVCYKMWFIRVLWMGSTWPLI
jgi:hypothetical protein